LLRPCIIGLRSYFGLLLFELLLMLMFDGQLSLTMSILLTLIVPWLLALLTPPVLPCEPAPLAMEPELCVLELPRLPLVAEPLTPPVPALALVEGADPLWGRLELLAELEGVLALAVVLVSVELDGEDELAELDGVDALALILPEPEVLALAEVVSSVPWTFTWWPRCAERFSALLSFHMPPFLVAR
jgi:hypothetical protein